MKTLKTYSKFISLVLRHEPTKHGILLDEAGWTNTGALIKCVQEYIHPDFDLLQLEEIVRDNNKKRFELNDNKSMIRARQGHSVEVKLGYESVEPPEELYHGTKTDLNLLFKTGIKKMKRHAVHMTADFDIAAKRGEIIVIEAKRMYDDGFKFYVTDNNVWLTEIVPPKYLQ